MFKRIFSVIVLLFALLFGAEARTQKETIDSGLKWLRSQQKEDGSFMEYPAITALCVSSFLRNGISEKDPAVKKGVGYIFKCVRTDGSIAVDNMSCYNTSICLMTLNETGNREYAKTIEKAREWLKKTQVGADGSVESVDKFYGGIGYDSKMKPDLSNLQHALEALKATVTAEDAFMSPYNGKNSDRETFERAIFFLSRCQNIKATNDQKWSGNDGGFIYSPDGESKATGAKSYGSMTYAGLKSFIYCDMDRTDPRVLAAYNWIRANYTLQENPNMGEQGIYYYYHTLVKTFKTLGDKSVKDSKGVEHFWAKEMTEKLDTLQNQEGYWVNNAERWWESKKELATAYALLALSYCTE